MTDDQNISNRALQSGEEGQSSFGGNVVPLRRKATHPVVLKGRAGPLAGPQRVRRQSELEGQANIARKGTEKTAAANPKAAHRKPRKLNRAGLSEVQIKQIGTNTIGQRMTQSRLKLNLTQEEVAGRVMITSKTGELSGVKRPLSRNAYCMYEGDFLEPSVANMISIAKALGVDLAWLAFGKGKAIHL